MISIPADARTVDSVLVAFIHRSRVKTASLVHSVENQIDSIVLGQMRDGLQSKTVRIHIGIVSMIAARSERHQVMLAGVVKSPELYAWGRIELQVHTLLGHVAPGQVRRKQ